MLLKTKIILKQLNYKIMKKCLDLGKKWKEGYKMKILMILLNKENNKNRNMEK